MSAGGRRVAALALTAGLAAGLSGCGGGDSTVSGDPATETMAPPPATRSSDAPAAPGPSGRYAESPRPVPSGSAASGTAGSGGGAPTAREKSYLDALGKAGVQTEQMRDPLVAAGNTVCRIKATGGRADETTTIADAVAGQLVAGGYSAKSPQETSTAVVDAASTQLCP